MTPLPSVVPSDLLATSTGEETGPPELREGLDPLDVSPGLLGFAVIFAVVVACIPLFRSMTTKLRNVDQRSRQEADDQVDPEGAAPAAGHDREVPPADDAEWRGPGAGSPDQPGR